jgi:GTP cyclohydrolase IA
MRDDDISTSSGSTAFDRHWALSTGPIRARIAKAGASFRCNDNIAAHLKDGDLDIIHAEVMGHIEKALQSLLIDTDNDHNTRDTAHRVAKMLVHEAFVGRYTPPPRLTDFPNAKNLDEIYTVGPVSVRSMCAHHLLPITGHCWVGIKPGDRIIGLSKFTRLARWVLARPHIQEEAVIMLADEIESAIKPEGLAVLIRAEHQCMTWRGVADKGTAMVTSVMRGFFLHNPVARAELMTILRGQGF